MDSNNPSVDLAMLYVVGWLLLFLHKTAHYRQRTGKVHVRKERTGVLYTIEDRC